MFHKNRFRLPRKSVLTSPRSTTVTSSYGRPDRAHRRARRRAAARDRSTPRRKLADLLREGECRSVHAAPSNARTDRERNGGQRLYEEDRPDDGRGGLRPPGALASFIRQNASEHPAVLGRSPTAVRPPSLGSGCLLMTRRLRADCGTRRCRRGVSQRWDAAELRSWKRWDTHGFAVPSATSRLSGCPCCPCKAPVFYP